MSGAWHILHREQWRGSSDRSTQRSRTIHPDGSIGLDDTFASWVGTLVPDIKQEILLITDPGTEEEAITRMARVGYDKVIGFLEGGFDAWKASGMEVDRIKSISPEDLLELDQQDQLQILDVRRKSEYDSEHVLGAENAPLDYINDSMSKVKRIRLTTYIVQVVTDP